MALTRTQMIDAYQTSDRRFDGRFYLCVRTTKIYCKPSCGARKPKPENVDFASTLEDAQRTGFRPCKRCRPDEDASDEANRSLAAIWYRPERFAGAHEMGEYLGKKPTALAEWTRTHAHRTPLRLLNAAKVERAMALLREPSLSVGEVGLEVGFESQSVYYERFGEFTGLAPGAYRSLGAEFTVDLGPESAVRATMRTMGRDPGSATERVTGDRLEFVAGDVVVTATVSGSKLNVRTEGDPYLAHHIVVRMFGLGQDVDGFRASIESSPLAGAHQSFGPLRLPMTADAYEALAWSILGQQIALPFAYQLRRTLYDLASDPIRDGFTTRLEPARVANLNPAELTSRKFSARKVEYLLGVSAQIVSGELDLEAMARHSAVDVASRLTAIRGLGPWTVNYVMMRGLGFADCLPVGDTGLRSGLTRAVGGERQLTVSEIETAMNVYRPHRSLATYLLWQSLGGAA